jgi:hypothetical protein
LCYTRCMFRERILKRLAVAIVSLFILNELATFFSWYSLAWWFDMPMHFLGGVSVFYIAAIAWLPALKRVPLWRYMYESIITAVLFGVLWEALELFLSVHFGSPQFILLDSMSDVVFDLAGACFAAYMLVPVLSV